jgi:ABC-type lipoprotein export system ATPase subunit
MKTISIHVEEQIYEDFQKYALMTNASAAELIRHAMREYHQSSLSQHKKSITTLQGRFHLGKQTDANYDDLMEEMLNG